MLGQANLALNFLTAKPKKEIGSITHFTFFMNGGGNRKRKKEKQLVIQKKGSRLGENLVPKEKKQKT